MDTSFRDGFQSCYGARVLTQDFLSAIKPSIEAGITHFESGGGARFQSLFFYCNESAFDMMDAFRKESGNDANLQTLARGINVVALKQQPKDIIDLHAKLFKKHGVTTVRNFDALNDIRNLEYSGERIKAHGLRHEITITLMDLPPGCDGAHTVEFYIDNLKKIVNSSIPYDSICFKDASGTAHPRKIYELVKQARKIISDDTVLWFHTHETAGTSVAQNIAAIEAGINGIDLAKRPCSGGTCQVDILTMWHALKGTEYTLDVDYEKILKAEDVFVECMKDYFLPPEAVQTSPLIPLSPMPGGALTANTMMMRDANVLHLYPEVIREMSDVVRKGGYGTSVTPVSQFYFQQAYSNVTQGKWQKITEGYGNMVLGYFGRPPSEPDPEIVKIASEQLGKPVFKGDPLEVEEPGIPKSTKILESNGLEVNDENIFTIASCESKGLDFLLGKSKVNIRKISDTKEKVVATPSNKPIIINSEPRNYEVTVDGKAYDVLVKPSKKGEIDNISAVPKLATGDQMKEICAPVPSLVLKVLVKPSDKFNAGDTLLVLEAMKMETEIKAPDSGEVTEITVENGMNVQTSQTLLLYK